MGPARHRHDRVIFPARPRSRSNPTQRSPTIGCSHGSGTTTGERRISTQAARTPFAPACNEPSAGPINGAGPCTSVNLAATPSSATRSRERTYREIRQTMDEQGSAGPCGTGNQGFITSRTANPTHPSCARQCFLRSRSPLRQRDWSSSTERRQNLRRRESVGFDRTDRVVGRVHADVDEPEVYVFRSEGERQAGAITGSSGCEVISTLGSLNAGGEESHGTDDGPGNANTDFQFSLARNRRRPPNGETRNETRNPKQSQMNQSGKFETGAPVALFCIIRFSHWSLVRISRFGFQISARDLLWMRLRPR